LPQHDTVEVESSHGDGVSLAVEADLPDSGNGSDDRSSL